VKTKQSIEVINKRYGYANLAHFDLQSEIWRHYRVRRPEFPVRRKNSGDSWTFWLL